MWIKFLSVSVMAAFLSLACAYAGNADTLLADRDVEKGWHNKARKDIDKNHSRNWKEGQRPSKGKRFDKGDRRPPHEGQYGREPGKGPRPDGKFEGGRHPGPEGQRPFEGREPGFGRPGEHPGGQPGGVPDRHPGDLPNRR